MKFPRSVFTWKSNTKPFIHIICGFAALVILSLFLKLLSGFFRKYVPKAVRKSIRRMFDHFSPRHPDQSGSGACYLKMERSSFMKYLIQKPKTKMLINRSNLIITLLKSQQEKGGFSEIITDLRKR